MKVTKKTLDALCDSKIFMGVNRKNLSSLLESQETTIVTYLKGEEVFTTETYEQCLGFVVKGSVNVIKPVSNVLISTLTKGDFFGAITLYSNKGYFVANLVATSETKVLFIDKTTIGMLMLQDKVISTNLIAYLSERLYYLNAKIDSFTGGTAETRLATYLNEQFGGYKNLKLSVSFTKLASGLNIGRASLYRAFDRFISEEIIQKDGKYIRLLDEEKLKSYLK